MNDQEFLVIMVTLTFLNVVGIAALIYFGGKE